MNQFLLKQDIVLKNVNQKYYTFNLNKDQVAIKENKDG